MAQLCIQWIRLANRLFYHMIQMMILILRNSDLEERLENFCSIKYQIVNILGFLGHVVSLSFVAIEEKQPQTEMAEYGRAPVKFYL